MRDSLLLFLALAHLLAGIINASAQASSECEVEAVSLNTGFDHASGNLYPTGAPDAFWTVVDDPDNGTTEPRPAAVINPHPAWAPTLPDSGWISAYATPSNNLNGPYDLETTFCLTPEWRNAKLDLCLRADDWAEVYLNGNLIGTTPNPSFNTASPTCITVTDQSLFVTGPNILQVRMINAFGVAMGVNLAGEVSGEGLSLENPLCCQPGASIAGQKFDDVNGNGTFDAGEPALAGWTIELSNGDTAVTDSNGFYYFMNLPAGTYTVSEVQQPGWVQTAPQSGTHSVTLAQSESVSGINFGNQNCVQIECPPSLEAVPCQGPDGTFIDFDEITATSACSDEVTLTFSHDLSDPFWPGTTVVEVVATDGEGNTATCEFSVTVVAGQSWEMQCPKDILITDCPAVVPDMTDLIGINNQCWPLDYYTITQNPPANTPLNEGTHPVIVTVTGPNGEKQECVVAVVVDCEPCETEAVSLNTGFDHTTGALYPAGNPDTFWTVVNDPDSGTIEPRPAAVINPNTAWAPTLPDSGWISAYPTAGNNLNGPYDLETTFCLLPEAKNVKLDLCLRADDWAEVYLNGTLIATTPNPSFNTASPTCVVITNPAMFVTGQNTVRVRMVNAFGVAMGVNLAGQVTGDGLVLEDPTCCQRDSSLSGQKFNDLDGDGTWDSGEPAMAGWTIQLSNGATTVTDSNGYYYFMNLPPGSYSVTEIQQGGWVQTSPLSGVHNVTLTTSQSVGGLNFGNFRKEDANGPPKVECSGDITIPCEGLNGSSATVSAQISDADGDPLTYVWEVNGTPVQNGSIPGSVPPSTGTATLTYAFPTGVNTVTITVTDSAGNTATCKLTVTVKDGQPPRIRCPEGVITIPAGEDCLAILPDMAVGAFDDCTPAGNLTVTQTPPAGTPLSPGMHTILVTVTDSAGNEAQCKVEVRVADKTAPVIKCPDEQKVEACEGMIPDLTGQAFIEDNCDPAESLTVTQAPAPGTPVGPGAHTINLTVVDSSGNTATCTTTYTVVAPPLSVEPIELFNSGVDATGTVLPDGSVDPHYNLTVSADPGFPGPDARVVNSTGYPMGSWILNDSTSKWIAPRADAGNTNASGQYVYEMTFTLPANFNTATISGRWLTDNSAELRLNGVPTGDTKPANGFSMWTNFNLTSGFVPGVNTLEFVVNAMASSWGADYPTGLRVELAGRVAFCENPCVGAHILQNPVSLIRPPGSTATFTVSAGGSAPLGYQWYFNNTPIPGETFPTLSISPVTYADAGYYSVLVTNECGEAVTKAARLRVRRKVIGIVGQWDFPRQAPLSATVGQNLEYLDPEGDPYESTASVTHFGTTEQFGIPGIDGQAVNVMKFGGDNPGMGYLARGEASGDAHTFVFDLFFPEGLRTDACPLVQADPANTGDAALSVQGIGGGDCDDGDVCVRPGEWARVAFTIDATDDRTTPLLYQFVNGVRMGERTLTSHEAQKWRDLDSDDDGLSDGTELLFFTDGFNTVKEGYVSSIQWHNTVLSDLEIAALGKPSADGIRSSSPYLVKPKVVIERDQTERDELVIYWIGEGFRLQESNDLKTWIDSELTPHVETIENEVVHEVTVPVPADNKRFYRVVED